MCRLKIQGRSEDTTCGFTTRMGLALALSMAAWAVAILWVAGALK